MSEPTPVFFHEVQLEFKPLYEWAFGERIAHPETTARAESILSALSAEERKFRIVAPKSVPLGAIRKLHNYQLLTLYNTATQLPQGTTFYPSVFPKSEQARPDPTNIQHAGCFCFDSGTPLNAMTLEAASWSAACAHEAATYLRRKQARSTYALSRPPGHHATSKHFGGYSYFNNAAIAARYLRRHGRVAVLDIDFHHGNGTQQLFYNDPNVLFVSIHGDPREFYPYFSGHPNECGKGRGDGFNLNLPLPGACDGQEYMRVLREHAIPTIQNFGPEYLVISAGHDTYAKDPIGHFALEEADFDELGETLGRLGYPTVIVQEGGYCTRLLGRIVRIFLTGFQRGQERDPLSHKI
ncbi:MAG: histone deacetylase family protein [Planctomycetes bacterium]|nr:histone deacetylase family protein [Planctomycetota bacterium]